MQLLLRQRLFSWLDSYDLYDEAGRTVFSVKGEPALGHLLRIYDANGHEVGYIRQKLFSWLPKFEMYRGEHFLGSIQRKFTLFNPRYSIDYCSWQAEGDLLEWDYSIRDSAGQEIAAVSKELLHLTDTYVIDVHDPRDALCVLMLVLAIDAENCSR